jgi:predicted nucleotidyltransferase
MSSSPIDKEVLKKEVASCLSSAKEIRKIIIFGSFLKSPAPHDMDIAVFQDSREIYLPLAMKYRKMLNPVSKKIAIDVLPIRPDPKPTLFLKEIENGEVIYER